MPGKRVLVLSLLGHASSRLRIGQYERALRESGLEINLVQVASPRLSLGDLARIAYAVYRSDLVFVQRIASLPLAALLRVSGRRIVYDVDDALHFIRRGQLAQARSPSTLRERLTVRYRAVVRGSRYYGSRTNPIRKMMALADIAIVGNEFVRRELAGNARSVVVLPTCVAMTTHAKEHHETSPVRIGWIGTADNLAEIDLIEPALCELGKRFGDSVRLSVVCSRPYVTASIATEFVPWSLETESESVQRFDIGIMPLAENFYARGKCSFKAIQCMAEGIPVVASPVGMNVEVVQDGVNGFLASNPAEWVEHLSALVASEDLRSRLGVGALDTVRRSYSYERGLQALRAAVGVEAPDNGCSVPRERRSEKAAEPRPVLDDAPGSG